MRIERMSLTNFRSHRKTEFNLNRVNIFRAGHGGGKSSTALAIEYCLTGRNALTDARGAGSEALVTLGESQMAVALDLGDAVITRSRNRAGGQLLISGKGKSLAGKDAEAAIARNCGEPDVLSAVMNATRFCRMDKKVQRALLAGALASDPVEIEPEIVALLQPFVGTQFPVRKELSSAGEVDRWHKDIFDLRAGAKRDLKAMGDLAEPQIPRDCPSEKDVSGQLAHLEDQKAGFTAQRARNVKAVDEANASKRAMHQGRVDKLAAARKTVADMGSWCIETSEELAKLQKLSKRKPEADKLSTLITENKAKREGLRQEHAKLSAPMQTECPTCKRSYDNLPDHSARLGEIDKEAEELDVALWKLQGDLTKLPNFEDTQRRLERHQQAMPLVSVAEAVVKDLGEIAEPEYPAANTTELDAEIVDLSERIAKGREIEKEVVRYTEQRRQYDAAKERRGKLEQEIAKLERLVEYFSPKGPIASALIGGKLPSFVARINAVLLRFGFCCEIELEPYSIRVSTIPCPAKSKV